MADRRAELEKKRLKLQQLRDEKERRKREKVNQEVDERDGQRTAKDLQEVDQLLISVGIDINPQRGNDFSLILNYIHFN